MLSVVLVPFLGLALAEAGGRKLMVMRSVEGHSDDRLKSASLVREFAGAMTK
jgi:hypothetical protein